ncbi:CPBP family intramembrane glutamic endopeptidase [Halocola ammonii]
MRKQKMIVQLATLTLVGMSAIGLLIVYYFQERTILELFRGKIPIWQQLGIGLLAGLASGWCAQKIVDQPFMEEVNIRYSRMIGELHLTWPQIVYVSLSAGIGEEILFRGAIQPFLGILITAVIFVAIHGYLNPRDWKISLYGLFMTVVISVLGWFTSEYGILIAIVAHSMIDLYLLTVMKRREDDEPEIADDVVWTWSDDEDSTEMDEPQEEDSDKTVGENL